MDIIPDIFFWCFLQSKTQEIRKRKEMEHEMLANPVQGYNGSVSYIVYTCTC